MDDNFANIEKVNFWNNPMPELGLIRTSHLSKIESFIGNKLIKVLVGQRRTGKSYLMRQLIRGLIDNGINTRNIFYLNKEFIEFDEIRDYQDLNNIILLYRKRIKPEGIVYILIDEVQQIKGWEILVNSYSQSYIDEYEIFITGSNSDMLSTELASKLTGRYVQFQIFPFSFDEFLEIKGLDKNKSSYLEYLSSTGLPELFHLPNDETKRHYVTALSDTIILRDIIERYDIREVTLLKELFAFLVNNASNLVSIRNIENYFKSKNRRTSYDTIANYIGYFVNSHLIHEVPRYNLKGKDILSGVRKYYINDLAYKNYLYSGFQHGYGYMLENLIYLQLLRSGYTVFVGHMRDKEIDFVAIKNDTPVYVQVCYLLKDEDITKREYSGLLSIRDSYTKVVISLDDLQLPENKGIKHVLAWEFDQYII